MRVIRNSPYCDGETPGYLGRKKKNAQRDGSKSIGHITIVVIKLRIIK
jgi:hypothetical protein